MRIRIMAIAEDVLNRKEVEIELEPVSIFRVPDEPGKVRLEFKIRPIIMDVSDGFNVWENRYK